VAQRKRLREQPFSARRLGLVVLGQFERSRHAVSKGCAAAQLATLQHLHALSKQGRPVHSSNPIARAAAS